MADKEEKLEVQHPESEQDQQQQQQQDASSSSSDPPPPSDPSSKSSGSGGGAAAWSTAPQAYGNKAGDAISSTLGKVGAPLGTGLEYGTRPVGSIVDTVVGGVMRSGEAVNDAPKTSGKGGIDEQIRSKASEWLGMGKQELEKQGVTGEQAQGYIDQAKGVVDGGGEGVQGAIEKAKEGAGDAAGQAKEGAEGVSEGAGDLGKKVKEGTEGAAGQAKEGGKKAAEGAGETGEKAKAQAGGKKEDL